MSVSIAAVVYADGVYPDEAIAEAIEPLRAQGIALAGAIEVERSGQHPCDMILQDLASGELSAIAEERGKEARGCRLDIGVLTGLAEAVESSLEAEDPCLLVVNKFGKIEADGGGLRGAIAMAVDRGIPVLVGVPARNLDRWRAFAGPLAVEIGADAAAIARWLDERGLPVLSGAAPARHDLAVRL